MAITNPLYAELQKQYQQLNYEEKRMKLDSIINALGGRIESYEETLLLINNPLGVSEEYLDTLYEIIMQTLSEEFSMRKAHYLQTVQKKFQNLVAHYELQKQNEIQEAELLLDDLED